MADSAQTTPIRDAVGRSTGLLFVAMVSVQLGASLAKRLMPEVGAHGMSALRASLAAVILLAAWRPWRLRIDRPLLRAVVPYGASLGIMNLLFYLALGRISLGIAVALEFTGPLALSLWSSRRGLDLVWALSAATGIGLQLPLHAGESVHLDGALFALGAGACWAAYIVFGQRASVAGPSGPVTALGMATAALVLIPFGAPSVVAHGGDGHLWLAALGVAIFSSALPYSLEMVALKQLPAKTFGILMSVEPAVAALVGLWVLHERLSPRQWLGIAAVIAAAAGSAWTAAAPPPLEQP